MSLDRYKVRGTLDPTQALFMCGCARRSGMPKYSRGMLRLLAVAAVVALLWPAATTLTHARATDFTRCVQACNDVNSSCNIQCSTDCKAAFTTKAERDACISACRAVCLTQLDTCKARCQAIHHGEVSPGEP